ncbi:MAG: hypothetical protein FJ206_02755 [Gemmatimonadetes bacterium]|nr:hypothetical protein [Gemmatimonadota bacterium]
MRGTCLIIAAVLLGCTSADVLVVDLTPRAVTADSVPVLLEDPKEPYHPIAMIEVSSGYWGASLQKMGRRLATEAAKLGGDAVVLTRRIASSASTLLPVGDTFMPLATEDSRLVGMVIVYRRQAEAAFDRPPR